MKIFSVFFYGLLFTILNLSGCSEPQTHKGLSRVPPIITPLPLPDTKPVKRIALVIGNGDYEVRALSTPVNDANDMAEVLEQMGFEVQRVTNAKQATMKTAIEEFGRKLHSDAKGIFYYSGHGMQYAGENFLIPIGLMSTILEPDELWHKAISATDVLNTMGAKSKLSIMILDACRDLPLPFKGGVAGLTGMQEKFDEITPVLDAEGILIAYATSPGKVALVSSGDNSIYTMHLLRLIKKKVPIETMLREVRKNVRQNTYDKQIPWYDSSIEGEIYLGGKPPVEVP